MYAFASIVSFLDNFSRSSFLVVSCRKWAYGATEFQSNSGKKYHICSIKTKKNKTPSKFLGSFSFETSKGKARISAFILKPKKKRVQSHNLSTHKLWHWNVYNPVTVQTSNIADKYLAYVVFLNFFVSKCRVDMLGREKRWILHRLLFAQHLL